MSGSTQATGTNGMSRAVTAPADLTVCFYFKVNGYDKTGFDSIISIENALTASNFRGAGIQQDSAGAGTADLHEGWWFNGSGPSSGFTPTLVNDTNVWHFGAIVWSGTSLTFYYGTETGTLNTQSLTSNFSSTAATIVYLGTDSSTENANVSFRGVRLWLASLNSAEITAERDSTTFAAVRSSNLDSDVRVPDGTNPEVATTGTSWTKIGTWATDASNPSFGTTAVVTPVLNTNRRAPGFPRRAPVAGIARLGSGILIAPTILSGSGGDAAAVFSAFAAAASGLLTFTASGSAAFSAFAADATGAQTMQPSGAPMAQPQPMASGFPRPARFPAPPPLRLNVGILQAAASTGFTGTAGAAFSPFAVTAVGLLTFTATGSSAFSPFAITATGVETFSGSGSAACSPFAVTGSALETFTCSGSAAMSPFAVSATGLETFTGSASAALSPFAVSCSGTESFTGSGSAACQPFGSTGNGAVGTVFIGSGSAAMSPFAASGSGLETFTASASAAMASFAISGVGIETFIGSGSAATSPFGAAGNASTGTTFTGSGSAAFSPFAVSGFALEKFTGSVSATLSPFAISATGSESFLASGSAAMSPFAVGVVGLIGAFIGVGNAAMSPFAISGLGVVPIIYQPPDTRLDRVATVKSRTGLRIAVVSRR